MRFVRPQSAANAVAAAAIVLGLGITAAPSPLAPDQLLGSQWNLKDRSAEIGGANVQAAWPSSTGAGVVIGIVDDGVQYTHPDLSPNYLASASYDFNNNDADPQPFSTSAHGTAVAGIAVARGDNTIGISGVAPMASLAALRLTAGTPSDAQEASAFGYQPDVIHILNNSWSPNDNGTTLKGPGTQATAARLSAATTGRNGKGRIFVHQSGNGRLSADDCNFDGYANSRFAIAVGAVTDQGNQAQYSEGCSALMILAPSAGGNRGITTTDLIATPGYNQGDYTSTFGTTSAAAPVVSGAVALMLARNPNLTWRDVQDILRRTAVRILPNDAGWTTGQFRHNERLGFGLLDTDAAVDLAGAWTNLPAEVVLAPATRSLNLAIPDVNTPGINDTITIAASEANFVIEHVEVEFDATHTWRGDLQVKLTAPNGVVSLLAPIRPNDSGDDFSKWKFGSARHWGDAPNGTWTLNVSDRRIQNTGRWNNWTLRIYGYRAALQPPGAFAKSSPASGATAQSTSPRLAWATSNGASSYEYCIDTTNDNTCTGWTGTGANASVSLSGLAPGTTFYWQARATNGVGTTYGNGTASAFWSFTTTNAAPGTFGKTSPADGATGLTLAPTISWGASSGATGYQYCIDTTDDDACSNWIETNTSTSAALTGLAFSTTYYWHVRSANAGATTFANGSSTAFWKFTTRARVTPIVDLNGDGRGDVFTYDPQTGAWARQVSNGAGGFTTTSGSWNPGWTVAAARFNTDALTDFFLFNPSSGQWFKMLNNGTGFTTQSSGSWWQGWARHVMDLDGDGLSDVFLYDKGTGNWFKCISTPNGFNSLQGGWNPNWEIYPMTLNADARGDMLLFNRSTGRWFWVMSDAGSGFTNAASESWFTGWQLYPGDFNGDGLSDLLLHDQSKGAFFVATAGASGFSYMQGGWSTGWTPHVADLNADGKDDVFLHAAGNGNWFELISDGAGKFTNGGGQTWSLGWQLHLTDLNADGRADVVLYHGNTGAWYQSRNLTLGSFSYTSGAWSPGLALVVRPQ